MEDSLEAKINYHFKNTDLLQRALLHRSRANEERQKQKVCKDQDALRTLGDAVLKTILCDLLMRSGYETKGEIIIMKSTIESRPFLAELGGRGGLACRTKFLSGGKGGLECRSITKSPTSLPRRLKRSSGRCTWTADTNRQRRLSPSGTNLIGKRC